MSNGIGMNDVRDVLGLPSNCSRGRGASGADTERHLHDLMSWEMVSFRRR